MIFSAVHIGIKLNQDYADFSDNSLVICDGIGSLEHSGGLAKFVVETMINESLQSIDSISSKYKEDLQNNPGCEEGTTIIFARKEDDQSLAIEYLGNGGIIHLEGNYAQNAGHGVPYRYSEIMLPHISPQGELYKHLSNHGSEEEFAPSKINLTLNHRAGDIIILYTDGISSLEDKLILKDDQDRFWRHEPPSIQFILNELHTFLLNLKTTDQILESLRAFNKTVLKKLKGCNYLEDDASLGFIISSRVFDYYSIISND